MKQVFVSSKTDTPSIIDCYGCPCATVGWSNAEVNGRAPWPIPGTFRNLRVVWTSSATKTATFRKGGSDTALAASVVGGTVGTSASNVTVAAGDLVSLKLEGSSPNVDFTSIEFEGDNARESGYINAPNGPSVSATRYQPLFRANRNWSSAISSTFDQNVVPITGVVGAIYFHVSTAPTAGKSWLFTIYKNGVAQDGTGGTPDTRVTIADAATTGNATFSLTLAVGDLVAVQAVPSGTPAGSGSMNVSWGVKFTADTDGYSLFCGQSSGNLNAGSTAYQVPSNFDNAGWVTTEADNEDEAGLTAFALGGPVVALVNAPGASKSFVFTGRVNSSTPSGAPSVTIAGAGTTTGTGTGSMTVSPGDTFALQSVPSGTPSTGGMAWAFSQFIALAASNRNLITGQGHTFSGSDIFITGKSNTVVGNKSQAHGENGTVRGNRSVLFNLDGVTRTLTGDDKFEVYAASVGGDLGGAAAALTYLTEDDETADLPNSRRLLAGTGITFDDATPGERTIEASSGSAGADFTGAGHPQGSQSADPGQTYRDTTNDKLYIKLAGTGNTGWYLALFGGPASPVQAATFWALSKYNGALDAFGIAFSNYGGTTATSAYRSGVHYIVYTTGSGAGANGGIYNTNFAAAQFNWSDDFDVTWSIRTDASAIADTRYSFGLSTTDPSSDTYTNAILIRHSSVADGSTWVGVTTAAGSQSVTSTLGSIAANTAYLLRIRKVSTTVYFSVNNGTEVSATANIPSAGQPYLISLAQNIAGSGGTRSFELRQMAWLYGG